MTIQTAVTEGAGTIAITSQVLGDIEVEVKDLIRFCEPIPGFPGSTAYALVPHVGRDGAVSDSILWLQSMEDPFHAFILTDPWNAVADYVAEIPDADAAQLGLASFEDARVMAILTVPPGGGVTINLRAPIVFNVVERTAKQVVLMSDQFGTRHPLGG